jgi:hypothetical protein
MAVELITKDDLQTFKTEVLNEIRQIIRPKGANLQQKEWLKSFEVRKLLSISPGTLQNMRVNGTIVFTKIGGLMFYKYEDIMKLMEDNRHNNPLIVKYAKK